MQRLLNRGKNRWQPGFIATRHRQTGEVPIWLVVVLGVLGGLLLYGYTTPKSIPTWLRGWLPGLTSTAADSTPGSTQTVYRWEDAAGQTQITTHPPSSGPYQILRYRSDVNVLQAEPSHAPQ